MFMPPYSKAMQTMEGPWQIAPEKGSKVRVCKYCPHVISSWILFVIYTYSALNDPYYGLLMGGGRTQRVPDPYVAVL